MGIAVRREEVVVCWEQLRWSTSFQSVGLWSSPATKKAAASQAWQPRRRPEEQQANNWHNIGSSAHWSPFASISAPDARGKQTLAA